jgi:hypothetical protein
MYELFSEKIDEEKKIKGTFLFVHFDVETGETGDC